MTRTQRLMKWWRAWREGRLGLNYLESLERDSRSLQATEAERKRNEAEALRLEGELDDANEHIEKLEGQLKDIHKSFNQLKAIREAKNTEISLQEAQLREANQEINRLNLAMAEMEARQLEALNVARELHEKATATAGQCKRQLDDIEIKAWSMVKKLRTQEQNNGKAGKVEVAHV